MGSSCSCCSQQPEAAQRYAVHDEPAVAQAANAGQHNASSAPLRPVTPPRPAKSIVPHELLKDSPAQEQVELPLLPPSIMKLSGEYSRAIDKKESAYRAKILSEEFSDRSSIDVQRRWWSDRILDMAAQEDLLVHEQLQHQQSVRAQTSDRTGRISPTDLRAAVMVEEFIIAPAAFLSRNILADSGAEGSRHGATDSLSLRLSPLRARGSVVGGLSQFGSPVDDPMDEILGANMDDEQPGYFVPPPRLDFLAPAIDGAATSSPWRYGGLNPFDEGVRMEMVQYLAMFSASPQRMPFHRSMIRELNHDRPHSRGDVVQRGDPSLGVALDEVDGRDVIHRYWRHEGYEIALLEAQERGIRAHMEYGRGLLKARMACWVLWLLRFEHHQRMVIEQEHFHAVLRIWSGADKRITLRRAHERELHAAADRAVRREQMVADEKAALAKQQRKSDKLKWDGDRLRLKRPIVTARDSFVEKLRAVQAAAPPEAASGISRARHAQLLALQHLDEEEIRWRGAIELECRRRWDDVMNLIISLSPALINAPDLNDILSTRQQARLIAAQLDLQRLEKRLSVVSSAEASDAQTTTVVVATNDTSRPLDRSRWDMDRFAAEVAILGLDEAKRRKTQAYQETLFRAIVLDTFYEEHEVHRVHDERREAERRALEDIAAAEAHELACHETLRRVGRGYLWRKRLGVVCPVADDARFLVEEHHRFHKHTLVMENIVRGDMLHYCALLSKMYFPQEASRMIRDLGMYLWTTDCLPHVEKHCREQLEAQWIQELEGTLHRPFVREKEVVALIPKVVSEGRIAAAKCIQRAYRGHRNALWFAGNLLDVMTLAKEKRLLLHAERRLLSDRETNERDAIVAEWFDSDWASMKRASFQESERRWKAATRINSAARGCFTRRVVIPPLLEQHLKARLKASIAKGHSQP